jgi:transcriptional regulator with PAS, ATPase and Fis domain
MQTMFVPAEAESGKTYLVLKNNLNHLIKERKIQKFRRSNAWLDIDEDERREDKAPYDGPERRVYSIVHWSLFSLPIAEQLRRGQPLEAILGYGEKAGEIALQLRNVAKTNLSVLIQGKTGTGKGIAASIIHALSTRKDRPFVRVDCGTIPPTLIESELFGWEKGSFTGASRSMPGKFQLAKGGTLFLDEIANLSMEMQTRLLGFFEERVVNSIGGVSPIKLDVRVISATNADLTDQIRSYQFREDLFYRLNEFEIQIPPLRDRPEDIFYLATKFLLMANAELEKNIFGFSVGAIDFLSGYPWKGNVRELKNLIKRAVLLTDQVIEMEHLMSTGRDRETALSLDCCLEDTFVGAHPLSEINDTIRKIAEKKIIERVYEQSHRNKKRTAEALGIDYSTLFRKMKEYAIQ